MTISLDEFLQHWNGNKQTNDLCPGKDLVLSYYSGLFCVVEQQIVMQHFSQCSFCLEALERYRPGKEDSGSKSDILLRFSDSNKTIEKNIALPRAAGTTTLPLPPYIDLPTSLSWNGEKVRFVLDMDATACLLTIGIEGASAATRTAIHMRVYYVDNSADLFSGKDIAIAGRWSMELSKINRITMIEFVFHHD